MRGPINGKPTHGKLTQGAGARFSFAVAGQWL